MKRIYHNVFRLHFYQLSLFNRYCFEYCEFGFGNSGTSHLLIANPFEADSFANFSQHTLLRNNYMKYEEWSSRLGFILASTGSAVGIGNIWRFPYIMGVGGGGAFVLAYLISVLIFGIPLMLLEFSTGKKFKLSLFNTFKKISPKLKFLALIPLLTVFFIICYYIVVTGWTLAYFVNSILGRYEPFELFVSGYISAALSVISLIISAGIISLGVRKGIENSSKILVPILFIILFIILLQTIQLPKGLEGIGFYFTPDFSKLSDYKIWLLASAQALFSLSVGYGILLTYGSYLGKRVNIFKSSATIAFADTFIALMAAMMIFSTIYSFGMSPVEGPKLAFVVLPQIFQSIKFGFLLGSLFFLLLFIAAITSSISMIEVITRSLKDYFNLERVKATLIVFILILLVSIPVSLSYTGIFKVNFLESMDYIFGSLMTLLSAVVISVFISWHWKLKTLIKEMGIQRELPFDKWLVRGRKLEDFLAYKIIGILIKFIVPTILLILFLIRILGTVGF